MRSYNAYMFAFSNTNIAGFKHTVVTFQEIIRVKNREIVCYAATLKLSPMLQT